MSERKILNRYYPPDFDPKKLDENKILLKKNRPKRTVLKKKKLMNIRMLYPFTIKCNECDTFHYTGTKLNSRVEKMEDKSYLGIPIWRFHCRCNQCGNNIKFRTDPKTSDYKLESGATKATLDIERKILKNEDSFDVNTEVGFKSLDELEILKALNKRLMNREVTELSALKLLFRDVEETDAKKNIGHVHCEEKESLESGINYLRFAEEDLKLMNYYIDLNDIHGCNGSTATLSKKYVNKSSDELDILDSAIVPKVEESLCAYLDFYNSDVE